MTTSTPEYMADWLGLVAPKKEPAPAPLTEEERKTLRAAYHREWQRAHYDRKTERKPYQKSGIFVGVARKDPEYQRAYQRAYRNTPAYRARVEARKSDPAFAAKRAQYQRTYQAQKRGLENASSNAVVPKA